MSWPLVIQMQEISPRPTGCLRGHILARSSHGLVVNASPGHLLAFQLAAALEMVSQWIMADSTLIGPEARLTFRHLKTVLFDILVPVRLAAGGQAAESLFPISRLTSARQQTRLERDQPEKGEDP